MRKVCWLLIAIMVLLLATGCSANEDAADTVQIAENEVPLSGGAEGDATEWEAIEPGAEATSIDPAGLLPGFLQLSSADITEAGGYTHSISGTDYGVASKSTELLGRYAEVFIRYNEEGNANAIYYNATGLDAHDAAELFTELTGMVSETYGACASSLLSTDGEVSEFTAQDIVDAANSGSIEANNIWLSNSDIKVTLALGAGTESFEIILIYLTGEYYNTLG